MAGVRASELRGGVSSRVVRVETTEGAWVLKQPLERFRVASEWLVDVRRARVEYDAARLLRTHLGDVVAEPIDFDETRNVLVLVAAPRGFEPWKDRLLRGRLEPEVAGAAADLLARIHRLGPLPGFENVDLFHQQRIEPYFVACAARHPGASARLHELARQLTASRRTLIHGDFSPKNLLTDGARLLLVDHEVATIGEPRFDLAFLASHLLLKAFHGVAADGIAECFEETLYRYGRAQGPAEPDEEAGRILAGLLLARVEGRSPVEYLTGAERDLVRSFALQHLQGAARMDDMAADALQRLRA